MLYNKIRSCYNPNKSKREIFINYFKENYEREFFINQKVPQTDYITTLFYNK